MVDCVDEVKGVCITFRQPYLGIGARVGFVGRQASPGSIEFQSGVAANRESLVMRLTEFVTERAPQVSEYERQCIRFR